MNFSLIDLNVFKEITNKFFSLILSSMYLILYFKFLPGPKSKISLFFRIFFGDQLPLITFELKYIELNNL